MESLKELKNIRQSLERQIDNSRNSNQELVEELDELNVKIKFIEEWEGGSCGTIPTKH